jgi:hypothetical protein
MRYYGSYGVSVIPWVEYGSSLYCPFSEPPHHSYVVLKQLPAINSKQFSYIDTMEAEPVSVMQAPDRPRSRYRGVKYDYMNTGQQIIAAIMRHAAGSLALKSWLG